MKLLKVICFFTIEKRSTFLLLFYAVDYPCKTIWSYWKSFRSYLMLKHKAATSLPPPPTHIHTGPYVLDHLGDFNLLLGILSRCYSDNAMSRTFYFSIIIQKAYNYKCILPKVIFFKLGRDQKAITTISINSLKFSDNLMCNLWLSLILANIKAYS